MTDSGAKRTTTVLPIRGKAPRAEKPTMTIDMFEVPAQDNRGHSARVGLRVVPEMKRIIAVLVQRGAFPWKTDSDFWRWAGWWGADYAAKVLEDSQVTNTMKQTRMIMDIVATRERLIRFEQDFAEMEKTVDELLKDEDGDGEDDAIDMLHEIQGRITDMNDDKWRKRWQKKLDKKYGKMLDGK